MTEAVLRFGTHHSPRPFEWNGMECIDGKVYYEPPSVKKLLLVEDNLATASRLGESLTQQAGYQVIVASDCLTALKFLRSCKPDLMLVDVCLLTRHGIDFLPRLQVMKDLQDIPLLLFSAHSPGSRGEFIPPYW
jgi:response regulator RpfG family c-di-GMP phosphodiesterase